MFKASRIFVFIFSEDVNYNVFCYFFPFYEKGFSFGSVGEKAVSKVSFLGAISGLITRFFYLLPLSQNKCCIPSAQVSKVVETPV